MIFQGEHEPHYGQYEQGFSCIYQKCVDVGLL